jgi:hypothetical protein
MHGPLAGQLTDAGVAGSRWLTMSDDQFDPSVVRMIAAPSPSPGCANIAATEPPEGSGRGRTPTAVQVSPRQLTDANCVPSGACEACGVHVVPSVVANTSAPSPR